MQKHQLHSNQGSLLIPSVMFTTVFAGLFAFAYRVQATPSGSHRSDGEHFTAQPRFALLCADDGTFSGAHELKYVLEAMTDKQIVHGASQWCQNNTFTFGMLSGVPVMVAVTGIGPQVAALCTAEVLEKYGDTISLEMTPPSPRSKSKTADKGLIFCGTSGFSPFVGGWDDEEQPEHEKNVVGVQKDEKCPILSTKQHNPIAIGSVCVTAASAAHNCQRCVHQSTLTSLDECTLPKCDDVGESSIFGECFFRQDTSLAEAFVSASPASFDRPAAEINDVVRAWFEANGNLDFNASSDGIPEAKVFGPLECAEIDSREFWVGAGDEMHCRRLVSRALNGAIPANRAVCVSAMEAIGAQQSVQKWINFQRLKHPDRKVQRTIPISIVAAASDYVYYPLTRKNITTIENAQEQVDKLWVQNETYIKNELATLKATYRYAVLTSNQVVLSFFQSIGQK